MQNKNNLQKTAVNHSSQNLYKKCTARPYSFLVNDTTLASDNSLHFRSRII